jgi:hypothetical protein
MSKKIVPVITIILLAAFTLSCCGAFNAPKQVVKDHLDAWSDKDVIEAYSYFARELKESIPIGDFAAQMERVPVRSFKLTSISISGTKGTAEIEGTVTLRGGDKMGLRYELVQKDDEWEIWGYKIHPDLLFED